MDYPRIPVETIAEKIYMIRNNKVMIDADVANLYGVEIKALNQAMSRNMERNTADNGYCPNGLIIEFWDDQIVYEFREDYRSDSVVVKSDYCPQNEGRDLDSTSDRDNCGDFSDARAGTQCPSLGPP